MIEEYQSQLVENLNAPELVSRLSNLENIVREIREGRMKKVPGGSDVNNHIHTKYSFSPYSPSKAVWMAYNAGLSTAGIMDHDSVGGVREFTEAGAIMGIATTAGMECRVKMDATELRGRRINNPDQKSVAYMAFHGIPHIKIDDVENFIRPYRSERNRRNRLMTSRINGIVKNAGIALDFDKDIVPLSMHRENGSITERHLLYALSVRLTEKFGKGPGLVSYLSDSLGIEIVPKARAYLSDRENPFYEYDLLGALKSRMTAMFYIDADAECPDVSEAVRFARETGAISAYAYLGDVTDSVTGDKKAEKFEDDYLELLFRVIKKVGFNAVTYMPSRNTPEQLERVRRLCVIHDLMQISGEDINSPRQKFICEALRNDMFANLKESTYALIGHESEAGVSIAKAMFSPDAAAKHHSLDDRTGYYAEIGRAIRLRRQKDAGI